MGSLLLITCVQTHETLTWKAMEASMAAWQCRLVAFPIQNVKLRVELNITKGFAQICSIVFSSSLFLKLCNTSVF